MSQKGVDIAASHEPRPYGHSCKQYRPFQMLFTGQKAATDLTGVLLPPSLRRAFHDVPRICYVKPMPLACRDALAAGFLYKPSAGLFVPGPKSRVCI